MTDLDSIRVKLSDGSFTQTSGEVVIPADLVARLNAPGTTCGHPEGCGNPATHQMARPATDLESAAWWDVLEQNIVASGNPDYVQDRTDDVRIAEHRCDDPQHADPAYLEAKARQDAADAG